MNKILSEKEQKAKDAWNNLFDEALKIASSENFDFLLDWEPQITIELPRWDGKGLRVRVDKDDEEKINQLVAEMIEQLIEANNRFYRKYK